MPSPPELRERNQDIIESVKAGQSICAIADRYSLSRQRVHQIVQKESGGSGVVDVRGRTYGPVAAQLDKYHDDIVHAYVNELTPVSALAKRYGVSYTAVRNWLIARGIPTRTKGWLSAQRATVLQELIDSGMSIGQAAKKMGLSRPSAAQLIELGLVQSPYNRYGKKYVFDIADAARRHAEGEDYTSIGMSIGVPPASVRSRVVYYNKTKGVDRA